MDRNWLADASQSTPDLSDLTSQGYPTDGDASLGVAPTKPGAAWYYMIAEELRNIITEAGLTPDHTDITQLVQALRTWQFFPTGAIMPWPAKTAIPSNWLIMNGQSVSKATYSDLNALINSDSSLDDSNDNTQFVIPDMTDRVWQGCSSYSDVLTAISPGLPNITGAMDTWNGWMFRKGSGALSVLGGTGSVQVACESSTNQPYPYFAFDASASNALYGASTTVQPLARYALTIIRA